MLTALVLISILIGVLFYLPLAIFYFFMMLICILAAWEWCPLAGFNKIYQKFMISSLFGMILLLLAIHSWKNNLVVISTMIKLSLLLSLGWWILAFFLIIAYPDFTGFWRDSKILRLIFGMLTIVPFSAGIVVLRQFNYEVHHDTGAIYLLYIISLVVAVDSGSYVFGKFLGKHPFIPKISPYKTWEGLVGGLLTSALIYYLFSLTTLQLPFKEWSMIILIVSIISVAASILGDLTESMFKREAGIKESSNLLPGHGGVLDRIDSLTAAIPIFACLLLLFGKLR
ncbi:MAG: phosphatidate cytidylyltransferase [Candidatus Dasytiphilus stammeri]